MTFDDLDERLRGLWKGPLLPTLLTAIVHYPIVADYFKHDDFIHLYQIANHGFWEFLLTPHGGHLLATSNLVFYVLFQLFGLQAEVYHGVALATHLLNVALLYHVIHRITDSRCLAVFGAALWGMAPIDRGSIGWFSVYGHVLATTLILWVLVDVARLRKAAAAVPAWTLVRWYVLLMGAAMSFGVGLGVAACFGIVVFSMLPEAPNRGRVSVVLSTLLVVLPGLFVLQHSVFESLFGPLISDGRDAVLQLYRVPELIAMSAQLLAFASASLALGLVVRGDHGNQLLPVFQGHETALAWFTFGVGSALVGLVLVVLWRTRGGRMPIVGFGVMAVVAYAVIAAGRIGVMGRAPSMLWMVSSPRYHYLGTLAICLVLMTSLARAAQNWSAPRRIGERFGWAILVAWLLIALPLDMSTAGIGASNAGARARSQHERVLAFFRRVIAAKPEGAPIFIDNQRFKPVPTLRLDRFPGSAAAFVFSFPENIVDGRRVYFVEKRHRVRKAARARAGTRIAELVVSRAQKAAIRERWLRNRRRRAVD